MSSSRAKALRDSTSASTPTQWQDEQWDVPPIKESDRAHYMRWLESSGFLPASDANKWEAICSNWVSFLSATSAMPKIELAPRRKQVVWGPTDSESPQACKKRFREDRRARQCIQEAIWVVFDNLEAYAERWPTPARLIVNQSDSSGGTEVFRSWSAKINLKKRRRGNSMWTGLITFLIHSYHEGTLEEMGLEVSEKMMESILDIAEAEAWHGAIGQSPDREMGPVEEAVMEPAPRLIKRSTYIIMRSLPLSLSWSRGHAHTPSVSRRVARSAPQGPWSRLASGTAWRKGTSTSV